MAPSIKTIISTLLLSLFALPTSGRLLESTSLATCLEDSKFTATLFDVSLTPQNNSLNFDVVGLSTIQGKVTIEIAVFAYGLKIYTQTINPCDDRASFGGMCPMQEGPINIKANQMLSADTLKSIPGESKMRAAWSSSY